MDSQDAQYDQLLAEYSNADAAVELLKRHRPYLELMPSMRRPLESILPIPLPLVRLRDAESRTYSSHRLEADVALVLCDPEWKVKTDIEIFIFIHRPDERFYDLLSRWRQTQALLGHEYYWVFPRRYRDLMNDGGQHHYPLFVLFPDTPSHLRRGLKGAALPHIVHPLAPPEPEAEAASPEEAPLETHQPD